MQFLLPPSRSEQFVVRAALHDRAVLDDEDQVGAAGDGEPVCDHNRPASLQNIASANPEPGSQAWAAYLKTNFIDQGKLGVATGEGF